jgi:general secretion pathway protein D
MTRHIKPLLFAPGLVLALGLAMPGAPVSAQTLPGGARATNPPQVPALRGENLANPRLQAQLPPGGVPEALDEEGGEDEGGGGGGEVRVGGSKAGVLDTGGKKIDFDPKALGTETPASAAEKLAKEAEDIIEWTPNFAEGAKARCRKVPLDAKIRLDFNEIALGDLTKFISCITEQNFILTSGANKTATVSILSPKPVTAYEAYKAYLSALEANGLTIVPNGSFLEIVPNGEARQQGAPIYGAGSSGPNDDRIVTRLIQLEHVEAQEILPVIDKFKTKAADVTIYAPTNTIILTDTGTNIRRLLKLIGELDVPVGKEKIWIRQIQYAEAAQVLQIMTSLFQTQGNAAPSATPAASARAARAAARGRAANPAQQAESPSSVVGATEGDITSVRISKMLADERTNSIILVASRSAYLRVDRLIRKIDVPIPGEGQIHIHPLENAKADEIASTLSALATGQSSGRATRGAAARGAAPGAAAAAAGGVATGALFEGEIKITAYEPTNSLVIESSLKDYLSLQKVIRELDVRRKQVYVEAIIMEISQNKQRDIGISGSGGAEVNVGGDSLPLLFGVGGLGLDVSSALSTLSSGGGALGLQGPLLDVSSGDNAGAAAGTFSIPAFGFLLKALQTTSNVNVLSTPHILTVENEEAEIQVGQRQPYRNQSIGGLGNLSSLAGLAGVDSSALGGLGGLGSSLGGLGSSVQYVDIDLTLRITPQVNASDFVRLEIDQSLDNLDGFFADAPITSTRQVRNVVVVRDGQPVVIGGLIRDQETKTTEKVPFLGDIPLLGAIFRRTSTTVEKRNLLVIIVPHVIKDPSDLKRIHEQRRKEYTEMARMMALRAKEFDGGLDYRKKTGLLEEIHMQVEHAKSDRQLREQSVFESSDFDTVGPPETHDIEYDPTEGVAPARGDAAPGPPDEGSSPPEAVPFEDER